MLLDGTPRRLCLCSFISFKSIRILIETRSGLAGDSGERDGGGGPALPRRTFCLERPAVSTGTSESPPGGLRREETVVRGEVKEGSQGGPL